MAPKLSKNNNIVVADLDQGIAIARTVALIMVVVLHVAVINFYQFSDKWWATDFYDSMTRSCVPIFFMISGALLLWKDEPLLVFFRKRVMRILPALLFWSLVYLVFHKATESISKSVMHWG